jgi:hypothetical protein
MASSSTFSANPDTRHASLCAICLMICIGASIVLVLALTFSIRCNIPNQQVFRRHVHVLIMSTSNDKSGTAVVVLIQDL